MQNGPMQQEYIEETGGLRGQLGRWWDQMRGRNEVLDEEEEGYEDAPLPERPPAGSGESPRRTDTFRIAAIRGSIALTTIANFADTQKVADRLKAGEPQIVNLERTDSDVAERLIDFLNGVTYALDGCVEKISEGAYLFTPQHIAINANGPEPPQPKPYFDRL
jgi:cell division inhibitor SepF